MSEPVGDDPLERLRRANPVDPERLPSASLARVRARLQEDSMRDGGSLSGRSMGRSRVAFGAVTGALLAVALVALIAPRASAPGVLPGEVPPSSPGGPISASCVETYGLDGLGRRTFAFDGTVLTIDGDEVTFEVNDAFRGVATDRVALTATGMTAAVISSAGGPNLVPGERYLVAGDDRFVWACGFTQDYDPAIAATWRETLGG